MKNKYSFKLIAFVSLFVFSGHAIANSNVDELLETVRQGMSKDAQETRKRLKDFDLKISEQEGLIAKEKRVKKQLEQRSEQLEQEYSKNEKELSKQQERLTNRLGNLKEMFGVLQQVSGDTKGIFQSSVVSVNFPGRDQFLDTLIEKSSSTSTLPSMEELEKLWFEIHQEITYSGKIEKVTTQVVSLEGEKSEAEVLRVGSFNVVNESGYLIWDAETQSLVSLGRQPASYMKSSAQDMFDAGADEGTLGFWLDPSRGSLLSLLMKQAQLGDRVQQGGIVGYIILALGVLALMIGGERLFALSAINKKVKQQIASSTPSDDNPLGRIMKAYDLEAQQVEGKADIEALELSVAEAITKETPAITRLVSWIKIIAAIAPLMGLLGTVTGMINTFEVMSLFGTGDPKLMAGGISQALVTTVLGLSVAIPAVMLHAFVNERSKGIIHVLEEKAIGMMAVSAEKQASDNKLAA